MYGFNPHSLKVLLEKYGLEIINLRVYANPKVVAGTGIKDQLLALVGSVIKHIANLTGTANNMYVWVRKK